MATRSANAPSHMKVSGFKSVEHDAGGHSFSTSSGDHVASNHQHTKGKNAGVTSEEMMKFGRNLARAKNQGN